MLKRILFTIIILQTQYFSLFAQGKYRIEQTVSGSYSDERILNVSIYNENKSEYTVSKTLYPYYSIPQSEILSNGNLILIHSLEGKIEIYDKNSSLIFQNEFYVLPPYREQIFKYDINEEGILIIISENDQNTIYSIFNRGDQNFKLLANNGLISGIVSSSDSKIIVYSCIEWVEDKLVESTTLLDRVNNLSFTIPVSFETAYLNAQNSLLIGNSKKTAFLLDLNKFEIVWEKKLSGNKVFIDTEFQNDNIFFLVSTAQTLLNGKWFTDKIEIIKKSMSGAEILLNQFNEKTEDARLISEGGKIFLVLRDEKILVD